MIDFDGYVRAARLAPAYLVFLPAIVFVVVLSLGSSAWWSTLGGILAACGAPLLAAEWGRSGGRRKQPQLYERWGGAPTTALLRHRDAASAATVARRHEIVERATGVKLPTAQEEAADPTAADAIYENAVATLRELIRRDEEQFPLVLKENISYGFRRNLWGRKPYGIAVAALALGAAASLLVADAVGHEVVRWEPTAFAAGFAAVALVAWLTTITPEWVREAGEDYAARLLDSAILLPQLPP